MELEAAWLMTLSAATRYDKGLECGATANAAKYPAAEAGYKSCETAVMTHGGFGYASEYHVERYLREVMIPRIAPISPTAHLVLHRRASTGIAEVILTRHPHLQPLQLAVAREVRAWRFSKTRSRQFVYHTAADADTLNSASCVRQASRICASISTGLFLRTTKATGTSTIKGCGPATTATSATRGPPRSPVRSRRRNIRHLP